MSECKFENCEREAVAQGFCLMHYKRAKRSGKIANVLIHNEGSCIVDGCDNEQFSKGLCTKHYREIQRKNNEVKCSVDGCNRPHLAEGFCAKHYQRAKSGKPLEDPVRKNGGKCSFDGCEKTAVSMGMCSTHYMRFYKHGDANVLVRIAKYKTEEERKEAVRHSSRTRRYQKRSRSGAKTERWTKAQVIEKSQGVCALCGLPIDLELKSPNAMSFSIDHIVPLSKGGSNLFENVQAAHLGCNCKKQDKM